MRHRRPIQKAGTANAWHVWSEVDLPATSGSRSPLTCNLPSVGRSRSPGARLTGVAAPAGNVLHVDVSKLIIERRLATTSTLANFQTDGDSRPS